MMNLAKVLLITNAGLGGVQDGEEHQHAGKQISHLAA